MTSSKLPADGELERQRVGATLRQMRKMRGFDPDPFANAIGISRPYLANIEAGRRQLTDVLLARAAQVLKVEQISIMRPSVSAEDSP